jgi:hypothetical protein
MDSPPQQWRPKPVIKKTKKGKFIVKWISMFGEIYRDEFDTKEEAKAQKKLLQWVFE